MEKQRQIKILSIIALVLAITGMTLGFAAFSTTLNISSSASVSPNSSDFSVKIYGIESFSDEFTKDNYRNSSLYTSTSMSAPLVDDKAINIISADQATVTKSSIRVGGSFFAASEYNITYYFMIQNEGKYDAKVYFDGRAARRVCTALEDTQQKLADEACPYFNTSFKYVTEDGTILTNTMLSDFIILEKGQRIYLTLFLSYDYKDAENKIAVYADGPIKVSYKGFNFVFTSAVE